MHLTDVSINSSGKILGVHVKSKNGKNLTEQLLLMEIVKLEGSIHSVYDGMLVYESREFGHNSSD